MEAPGVTLDPVDRGVSRGWPRAAALVGVTLVTAIMQPAVLMGVPFVVLGITMGIRRISVFVVAVLATALTVSGGIRDGLWYIERGWAVLAAGWFAALTLRRPASRFSSRALGAVGAAAGVAAVALGLRAGAWASLDWAVRGRMSDGVATALEAFRLLRGGDALSPTLVATVYQTVEAQAVVFPAMLGVATMAGLGVAWWLYLRLAAGTDQGVGPLKEYRFNDHLVWVMIGGLVLLVGRMGDAPARFGANAVVFMGALYALRGGAVILFLSGGMSLFGYVLLVFGLLFLPPLVLTGAMVIGIGDTWLDIRSRMPAKAA